MRVLAPISFAAAVAAIAYFTMLYNVEWEKQNAIMMKVCMEAGGKWTTGWRKDVWWCERPVPSNGQAGNDGA